MAVNKYKAPKKMWRRWGVVGQRVFNEMFATLRDNPRFVVFADEPLPTKRRWRVVAWNTAWLAADATRIALDGIAKKGS
jgi:hypothetical protein